MKHDSLLHRVQASYKTTLNKLNDAISKAESVDDLERLVKLQIEAANASERFYSTISNRGIIQLVNAYHAEFDKKFLSNEELDTFIEKETQEED